MTQQTTTIVLASALLASAYMMPATAAWPFVAGGAQQTQPEDTSGRSGNPGIEMLKGCGSAPGKAVTQATRNLFPGQMMQSLFPFARAEPAYMDAGEDLSRSCPTDSESGSAACLFQRLPFGQ